MHECRINIDAQGYKALFGGLLSAPVEDLICGTVVVDIETVRRSTCVTCPQPLRGTVRLRGEEGHGRIVGDQTYARGGAQPLAAPARRACMVPVIRAKQKTSWVSSLPCDVESPPIRQLRRTFTEDADVVGHQIGTKPFGSLTRFTLHLRTR